MSYISECPVTESAWNQRSEVKACSPPGNYHCVRTQDGGIRELCTHPIWMQAGKCPYYNKAGRLDSSNCRRRRTLKCPTAVYISNQVFKYPSCFPEKREVTPAVDKSVRPLPTHFNRMNITSPVIRVTEEGGGNNSALAALILLLIPVVLAIMLLWKRKQIITWINKRNAKRHKETSKKDSTGKAPETEQFMKDKQANEDMNMPREKNSSKKITAYPKRQCEGTVSSSSQRKVPDRSITRRRVKPSFEPDLSMVDKMSLALSRKNMLIIIGLPGSGKFTLAQKITEAACRLCPEGANIRLITSLEQLNEMMLDKETFLILSDCIKSWFNEAYLNVVFKTISHVLSNKIHRIHLLLCVLPELWNKLSNHLLSSDIQYDVLDDTSYTNDDWDKIFNWHMRRNIEQKRIPDEENQHVKMCREEYRKHEAKAVGKPALAYLLCRSAKTLQNHRTVLENTRFFLESEINGLLNNTNNQTSFVLLVYLMLHNGEAPSNKEVTTMLEDIMETQIIKDICSEYHIKVKDSGAGYEVNYHEIEIKKDEMSIRSNVVLRATFDFVWKDHKDLIIRHCDDNLFLECISLAGCTKQEIAEIAKRFKSMIDEGKPNVEHHYLLDDSRLKALVQK